MIKIIQGDITKLKVDAIVNAANRSLLGGGGVDGAIHRAAGRQLLEECRKLDGCNTGESKMTDAYRLPCQKIIHTVGPIWRGGISNEEKLLASCYKSSLDIAANNHFNSIAFPCISTGVYCFPQQRAAAIAIETVMNHRFEGDVVFCCFLHSDYEIYTQILNNYN